MSETYYGQPLVITTSGGKDSDVCLYLAAASGIRYEVMHNHTSVDAPETIYHVREQFRRLEQDGVKCTINFPQYKQRPVTMWTLIPQKLMPPTRTVRYCCSILKETGGMGRMITTGVRWATSAAFSKACRTISAKRLSSTTITQIPAFCSRAANCRRNVSAIPLWIGRTMMCGRIFMLRE